MKKLLLSSSLCIALSTSAFAADASPEPPAPPAVAEAAPAPAPVKAPEAVTPPPAPAATTEAPAPSAAPAAAETKPVAKTSSADIQKMHAQHMQEMHARMAKIWGTENPEKRKKLMLEHQQANQAFQQKMRDMRSSMMGNNMMPGWNQQYSGQRWQQQPNQGYMPGMGRKHQGGYGKGKMCRKQQAMQERVEKLEKALQQMQQK